jgi:hypothetical protein
VINFGLYSSTYPNLSPGNGIHLFFVGLSAFGEGHGELTALVSWDDGVQALTVFRIVLKANVLGASRAVSTTVRTAASPSAAHIARELRVT